MGRHAAPPAISPVRRAAVATRARLTPDPKPRRDWSGWMTDWDSDRWPEAFIVVTIVLADLVGVYALVDRLTDGGFL